MSQRSGIAGQRVLIDFSPQPGSQERLCAGVVSRLDDGSIGHECAVDLRKAEHAFGAAGSGLWHAAHALCLSLEDHWRRYGELAGWMAPFEGARMGAVQRFSARDQLSGHVQLLRRSSALYSLMEEYEMAKADRQSGIVRKVRSAIKRDVNAKHLHKRFEREIHVGSDAGNLKVDFLGQHFACYFLQITHSPKGVEATAERAYSRLYELQALEQFVKKPAKSLGLLEDERPSVFELVMVGAESDPIQRRAISRVTALADKGRIRARPLPSPEAAAEHVHLMERRAA